jgi:hypothetical protein
LKESKGEATAQKALLELIRVSEFEKAGMTHLCCQRRADAPGPIAEDEVDEILDEERHFVSQLNNTMQHISQIYEGFEVEESWLKLLATFYKPQTELQQMKWTWATWKGGSSSRSNQLNPPPWHLTGTQGPHNLHLIRPNTAFGVSEPRFWIDESCDEFRSENGPTIVPRIHKSRLYSEWVEYFYRSQKMHDYPTRMDRKWHEHRKYWATRQSETLDRYTSAEIG